MFSSYVRRSGPTKFFARRIEDRQFLACELSYASDGMTSLVIPLPISNNDRERAVKIIDLSTYRDFFGHLERVFPRNNIPARAPKPTTILQCVNHVEPIVYWSTLANWKSKADPKFKLVTETWNRLPHYQDWGIVIVNLPDTTDNLSTVFPFALEFKTRLPEGMYFPTLDLSNNCLNTAAQFQYELYYQGRRRQLSDCPSTHALEESIDYVRSRPLLVEGLGYKRNLFGKFPNGDVII